MNRPKSIEEYIASFPKDVQQILEEVRAIIKKAAPGATELISYNMPAFKLNRILVYYGAHTNHIGLYPTASGIEAFKKEISAYKWAKGSVQFPFDKPMPVDLITRIVKFRVVENLQKGR